MARSRIDYTARAKAVRQLFVLPFNQRSQFTQAQKRTITRLFNQNKTALGDLSSGYALRVTKGAARTARERAALAGLSKMKAGGGAKVRNYVVRTERLTGSIDKPLTRAELKRRGFSIDYREGADGKLRGVVREPWGSVDRVPIDLDALLVDTFAAVMDAADELRPLDNESGVAFESYYLTIFGRVAWNFPFDTPEAAADQLDFWFAQYNSRWSQDIENGTIDFGLAIVGVDQIEAGMNNTLGV